MAISQSLLINKSASFQEPLHGSMQKSASKGMKSAFLCHSHKDEAIVKGLIVLFQEAEIDIYIDWKDHTMPDVPNVETAKKIQQKIKTCDFFFFLASLNSKVSRWCPWEIGYADSNKRNIYIISTSDGRDTYGNEYLQLYPRIDQGLIETREVLAIFEAGAKKGQLLSVDALS
ncbi:MAG: hypothetical protein A2252_06325 [Elusimicrobia bacterium RIFOXYA2_FULL_39_19]|nr:MAG: hypothetical protein A2252_06325 [Elusimicrobia bacterium RIFOXYA2_FULL_39_19]